MNHATNNQHPLATQFLGWQCRLRQHAVRKQEGRPPEGVRATVLIDDKEMGQVLTVINKLDASNIIAEFRFMVQKTVDPKAVHENALKYLSEYYYQFPKEFRAEPTALFGLESALADQLTAANSCALIFEQANQQYNLVAKASQCHQDEEEYQATYWHNHLFNPNIPGVTKVIKFEIDWEASTAS